MNLIDKDISIIERRKEMKNKGFTLIELLAVIVILAIIALIAVPIILNIIKDSKKASDERSIELYGKAIEQAVAKEQLNGNNIEPGDLNDEFISEKVEYKGSRVKCETSKLNTNGTVYLADCKVDNKDVDYTYGEEENKTITVYRWSEDYTDLINIGDQINPNDTTKFTKDPTTLGKSYYLKHVVDKDNKVTESYACAILNNEEYCLTNGEYGYSENTSEYTGNALILKGLKDEGIRCDFSDTRSSCYGDSVELSADPDGRVFADESGCNCSVYSDGMSSCFC